MTSKTVLVTMAVIIAISLAVVPLVKSTASPTAFLGTSSSEVLMYSGDSGYHFLDYSFNAYGQPISGATVKVNISDSAGVHSGSGDTNSSGISSFTLASDHHANGQVSLSLVVTYGSSPFRTTVAEAIGIAQGRVYSLTGNEVAPVVDSVNASKIDVLATYEGVGGAPPSGYQLYYAIINTQPAVRVNTTQSMSLVGTLTSYHQIFKMPSLPRNVEVVELALFYPNGILVSDVVAPASTFAVNAVTLDATLIFASFGAAILSILVPLTALLAAYGSYGKDRVSGVLESVLSRPVSRRGLSVSRYLSIVAGLVVALAVTVAVMGAISRVMIGADLGWEFGVSTFAALAVEAAAFVGIMMLFSHLVRSTSALIGITVVLWVFLDFFWGVILLGAETALGYGVNSASAVGVALHSYFFNPAQYYLLVGDYLNGLAISTSGGATVPISPAAYGLTPLTLGIDGLVWVALPFVLFFYLATRKD